MNDPCYSHCYSDKEVYLPAVKLLDEWVKFIKFFSFLCWEIFIIVGEINELSVVTWKHTHHQIYIQQEAGVVIGEIITHVPTTSPKNKGHMSKKSPNQTCDERKMKEMWKGGGI